MPVLCYHAVSEAWEHPLAVPPVALERQLRGLLRRGFRPGDAEASSARGRLLHVTFDDAFRSVVRALPALERLGLTATVFACPAYAERGDPLAVPELAREAEAQPDELATLAWAELRDLPERVEVGSHTGSHPHLVQLSDAELERELRGSREQIEEALGRPCRLLAYPYGEHDARVRAAAQAAGYAAAFALAGAGRDRLRDPYALPRVGVYRRDGLVRVHLKSTGFVRFAAKGLRRGALATMAPANPR